MGAIARDMLSQYHLGRWGNRLLKFVLVCSLAATVGPLQAAELAEIRQRGYAIVGIKDNVRPLGFRDETGQLQGFEIDLARRLAATLLGDETAVELRPLTNQERIPAVLEDRVDFAIARMSETRPRSRLVRFSDFYYRDGTTLVTRDPAIQTASDADGRTIAVLAESSTVSIVRYHLPRSQLVGVASYQDALAQLDAGIADAFAADISVLSGWIQEYPSYRLVRAQLSSQPLRVVMPKGLQYDNLHRQVSGSIRRWRTDGWLEQQALQWGLPWEERGWNVLPQSSATGQPLVERLLGVREARSQSLHFKGNF